MLLTELLQYKLVNDKKEHKISDVYGIIYRIYCKPENKSYIGQTYSHGFNRNKLIKKGLLKRIRDHYKVKLEDVNKTKPLYVDMNKYSTDDFEIHEEEKVYKNDIGRLNEIEGKYIEKYNTLHPNGYNLEEIGKLYPKILKELSKHYNFEIQRIKYVDKTRPKRCKDICFGVRFGIPKTKHTLDIVREKLKTIKIDSIRLMKSKKDSRMIVREVDCKDNIRIYITKSLEEVIKFSKEFTDNIIVAESIKECYKYQNKLDEVLEINDINRISGQIYENKASGGKTYMIRFYGKKNGKNQLLYKVSFGGKTQLIENSLKYGLEFLEKYKQTCNNDNIIYNITTEIPN
jgi:hypothetical protein